MGSKAMAQHVQRIQLVDVGSVNCALKGLIVKTVPTNDIVTRIGKMMVLRGRPRSIPNWCWPEGTYATAHMDSTRDCLRIDGVPY